MGTRVPALPYASPTYYEYRGGDRISDLLARQGEIAARGALQSGQAWGHAIDQIGQIAAGAVQQYGQQKEMKKREALFSQVLNSWDGQDPKRLAMGLSNVVGPEEAMKFTSGLVAFQGALQKQQKAEIPTIEELKASTVAASVMFKNAPGEFLKNYPAIRQTLGAGFKAHLGYELPEQPNEEVIKGLSELGAQWGGKGSDTGFSLSPGQTRYDASGKVIATGPPAEPKTPAVGTFEDYLVTRFGPRPTAQQIEKARKDYNQADNSAALPSLQSMSVLDDEGKPTMATFNPRTGQYTKPDGSVIRAPRPASNREQGRPVVSGDANKIADYDTSLNDVKALTDVLSGNKATGTRAKAGAMLPNWVTEITGWGTDAKSKQAVIDRVKQVIGKALEGGVLRKEDEYKYTKILPTIGDVPQVVTAKLKGLDDAIRLRRQTTLDALSDAGFDVSRYEKRGAPGEPLGGSPTTVTAPNGKTYTFASKAQADAFRKRAGF